MKPLFQTILSLFLILVAYFIFNIVTFTSLQCQVESTHEDDHIHFPATLTATEFANRLSQVYLLVFRTTKTIKRGKYCKKR